MNILNIQPVVLNGERIAIVAQIVQVIINCFEAKPYVQKDRKRSIFVKYMINQNAKTVTLPKSYNTLFFIKVHQPKKGKPNLDDILYRHVKQMVCDHTSYVLCTQVSGDFIDVSNISIISSVAGLIPENIVTSIGVMVVETKLEVKKLKNNCIIHYMCIFPNSQRKGYGRYVMSKVFKYYTDLDGRVYAVTRSIHDYNPYSNEEPESEYSDSLLYNRIQYNMIDDKDGKLRKPRFCKHMNQIKE